MLELIDLRAQSAGRVMTHNAEEAPGTWRDYIEYHSCGSSCGRKFDLNGQRKENQGSVEGRHEVGREGRSKKREWEREQERVKKGERERGCERKTKREWMRGRVVSASGIPQRVNQLSPDEGKAFHRWDAVVTQNQAETSDLKLRQLNSSCRKALQLKTKHANINTSTYTAA